MGEIPYQITEGTAKPERNSCSVPGKAQRKKQPQNAWETSSRGCSSRYQRPKHVLQNKMAGLQNYIFKNEVQICQLWRKIYCAGTQSLLGFFFCFILNVVGLRNNQHIIITNRQAVVCSTHLTSSVKLFVSFPTRCSHPTKASARDAGREIVFPSSQLNTAAPVPQRAD